MSGELFSERVKRWRLRHGLSQDEAGVRLGVSGRYIGMLERGDKEVELSSSLAKLFAIYESGGQREEDRDAEPEKYSGRIKDGAGSGSGPPASDEEIAGLAALVNLHAAKIGAGTHRGDIPVVRTALERALASRGRLPRGE